MSNVLNEYLSKWIAKANEDIFTVKQLLKENPEYCTSTICFHCQQALEKFLKAFLVKNQVSFSKTHDVDFLLNKCIDINATIFAAVNLLSLNEFAVSVRYPDENLIPTMEDVDYYSKLAFEIKNIVESNL